MLAKKLGLKEGQSVKLIQPPTDYPVKGGGNPPYDFIHLFAKSVAALEHFLPECKKDLKKDGILWVSWYKKKLGEEYGPDGKRSPRCRPGHRSGRRQDLRGG